MGVVRAKTSSAKTRIVQAWRVLRPPLFHQFRYRLLLQSTEDTSSRIFCFTISVSAAVVIPILRHLFLVLPQAPTQNNTITEAHQLRDPCCKTRFVALQYLPTLPSSAATEACLAVLDVQSRITPPHVLCVSRARLYLGTLSSKSTRTSAAFLPFLLPQAASLISPP